MKNVLVLVTFLAIGEAKPPYSPSWESDNGIFQVDAIQSPITLNYPGTTMASLVLSQGYPLEEYEIVTEDGYILTTFRIPYGKNKTSTQRGPLLLQHGLFTNSACWVISEPRKGLGFVLADAGFDVWFGNSRSSKYGMKHIKFNPAVDKEFFNYSFHEMGYFDISATIDFILNQTKSSRVKYVGHSQGTAQFYVLAATRPQYNRKVEMVASLAPISFISHVRGMTKVLAETGFLLKWAELYGVHYITTDSPVLHLIDTSLCKNTSLSAKMCENLMFVFTGADSQQFNTINADLLSYEILHQQSLNLSNHYFMDHHHSTNQSLLPVIADLGLAGASVKELRHLGQLITNGGKFAMFDYGSDGNVKHYGQDKPPEYNLKNVVVPMYLHFALNDRLSTVEDVQKLHGRLPNSTLVKVKYPAFNHIDFMWAVDVRELLYDNMIDMLKRKY